MDISSEKLNCGSLDLFIDELIVLISRDVLSKTNYMMKNLKFTLKQIWIIN